MLRPPRRSGSLQQTGERRNGGWGDRLSGVSAVPNFVCYAAVFTADMTTGVALQLTLFFFMVFLLISGVLIRSVFFLHRRRVAMEALAERLKFTAMPDNVLPANLSLQGTHFHKWTELTNVFHGLVNGIHVVYLDFRSRESKEKWSRTIIAANTDLPLRKPYDIEMKRVGQWQLFYSPVKFHRSEDLFDIDLIDIIIHGFVRS
jgi:hypothetical protein